MFPKVIRLLLEWPGSQQQQYKSELKQVQTELTNAGIKQTKPDTMTTPVSNVESEQTAAPITTKS